MREAGDSAILVELGDGIDPAVNARAVALAARLRADAPRGVSRRARRRSARWRSSSIPLRTDLDALKSACSRCRRGGRRGERPVVEVPVEYGGEAGPDLDAVAAAAACRRRRRRRHTARDYRVFMIGFLPGFAYLGPWTRRLRAPRTRRRAARAARLGGDRGQQTGIYRRRRPAAGRSSAARRRGRSTRTVAAVAVGAGRSRALRAGAAGTLGSFDAAWTRERASSRRGRAGRDRRAPGLMTTVQDGGRRAISTRACR
jgi:allophanate hydrolase subunit 1